MKKKGTAILSFLVLLFCVHMACAAADPGKQLRAVSSIRAERPGGGALLFMGTEHTFTPAHQQFADILSGWKNFRPEVALVEGGDWPIAGSAHSAIEKYGEMGYVTYLAAESRVPVYSLEPPFSEEVAFMTRKFDATAVKLFYALRLVPQWRATGVNLDKAMAKLLAEPRFGSQGGWAKNSDIRVEDLDNLLRSRNWNVASWRLVTYETLSSDGKASPMNEIARASGEYRNSHMTRKIVEAVRSGKRVFAIAGNSHLRDMQPIMARLLRSDD
jgi:hypothetical protein